MGQGGGQFHCILVYIANLDTTILYELLNSNNANFIVLLPVLRALIFLC